MKMEIESIGEVKSGFRKPQDLHFACENGRLANTESKIIINEEFAEGLKGLAEFSHIWVIYYLHKAEKIELRTHPGSPDIKNLPKVGIFASRSQYRPNHMALRLVDLVKINDREIIVRGLDAVDGSSVLDIKPYVPFFVKTETQKIAEWYEWTEAKI